MYTMKSIKDTKRTDDVVPHPILIIIVYQSIFATIRLEKHKHCQSFFQN